MKIPFSIQIMTTLSISLLLGGCHESHHYETFEPEDLYGVWERTGYGDVWEVDEDGAKFYQYTRETCIQERTLDEAALNDELKNRRLEKGKQSFSANPFFSPVFKKYYKRLDQLPAKCSSDQLITSATPTLQFEHFWHNFNDYYEFFSQRNINWQQQYANYRPTVSDDMTQQALISVFASMLSPINDSHISLTDGTGGEFSPGQPSPLIIDLQTAFQQQTDISDGDAFMASRMEAIRTVQLGYLIDAKLDGGPDHELALWGKLNGDIGYLQINRMIAIHDFDMSQGFNPFVGDFVEKELLAMQTIMDEVVSDFHDVDALVIDVRLNGGGLDNVAMVIPNYFTNKSKLAVSKYTDNWQGKTRTLNAYLKPVKQPLQMPIAILTSKDTGSAAETFVMAMRSIPEVSVVGQRSEGITSNTLKKSLLNGMEVTLSNELLMDHQGLNYEATGIPVDVSTTAFDLDGFANGKDTALDQAIDHLKKQIP